MSYRTIQNYAYSPSGGKRWLISGLKRLSLKIKIASSKWLSRVSLVSLIGALTIFGCTSENAEKRSGGQGKPTQQEKSDTTKPVRKQVGEASWYGPGFHGQETANGEIFDQKDMTAAHPTLPMGTKVKVTNLENNKKVEVRINDRGPYADGRVIDLSSAAAKKLDMKKTGTSKVKIETKPVKKKKKKKNSTSQSIKKK